MSLPVIRLPGGAAELAAEEFDTAAYIAKLRTLLPVGQLPETVERELQKVHNHMSALMNANHSGILDMIAGFRTFVHSLPVLEKYTEELRVTCENLLLPAVELRDKVQRLEDERQKTAETLAAAKILLAVDARIADQNHLLWSLQFGFVPLRSTFLELLAVDIQDMDRMLSQVRAMSLFPEAVQEAEQKLQQVKQSSTTAALNLLEANLSQPSAEFIGRCIATLSVFGEEKHCIERLRKRFFEDVLAREREAAGGRPDLRMPSRAAAESALALLKRLEGPFEIAASALQGSPAVALQCLTEPFLRFVTAELSALLVPVHGRLFAEGFQQVCRLTETTCRPLDDKQLAAFVGGPWRNFCSHWQTQAYETARSREVFLKVKESMNVEQTGLSSRGGLFRLDVFEAVAQGVDSLLDPSALIEKERHKVALELTQLFLIYLRSYCRELMNVKSSLLVACLRDLFVLERQADRWRSKLQPAANASVLERGGFDATLVGAKLDALFDGIWRELKQERDLVALSAEKVAGDAIVAELEATRAIPPIYRMTNKSPPADPSPYVAVVLEYLERTAAVLQEAAADESADGRFSSDVRAFRLALGLSVLRPAAAIAAEVLTSVAQQERAIRRVAKRSLTAATKEELTDEAKIRLQLKMDLEALLAGVERVWGSDGESSAGNESLATTVEVFNEVVSGRE